MKKIKDIPQSERPREKLLEQGAPFLSDQELLAVILGRGTQKDDVPALSKKIIKIIDEKGVLFSPHDITSVDGIGSAKAAAIAAAFEFVRRRIKPEGLKIKFPADVLSLIHHYADRKQEHFLSVSINGANEVMNVRVVSIGLVNKSHVHPREVFADVLSERASAVIVAHNHPHGELKPSPEDLQVTKQLKEAAKILGLSFLDHNIFNTKGYYFFAESDELQKKPLSEKEKYRARKFVALFEKNLQEKISCGKNMRVQFFGTSLEGLLPLFRSSFARGAFHEDHLNHHKQISRP